MTVQEMSIKIAELLQYTGDNPLLTVLPAYITQAQFVIKNAGVKDTVAESEKAVGAICRGVLDLWNFSAGDGKFSQSFFQMVEQLKYNDGVNGKLILDVVCENENFYFLYTDGTRSESFPVVKGEPGEPGKPGEPGPKGDSYTLTTLDKREIAGIILNEYPISVFKSVNTTIHTLHPDPTFTPTQYEEGEI
ncbi:MAG: collagen-like protein [Acutalibacteraceae bacterium]|nr:collagen-like protein [Acutalibacteraceae bacterium]